MFLLFITLFTLLSEWVLYQSVHRVEGLFLVKNRRRWWRNRKRKGTERKREKRGCRGQTKRAQKALNMLSPHAGTAASACTVTSACVSISRFREANREMDMADGCVCYAVFRDMDLNKTRHFLSHVRLLVSSYKTKQLWLDIVHVYMLNIFWPDVYTH